MKNNVDVTFHPSWWHKHAGIDFDEKFFFDVQYRIEADIKMRKVLYEYFGEYGIGEQSPKARPILFSDLIACGFLYSQLLGCEVVFSKNDAPRVIPANMTKEQINTLRDIDLDKHPLWEKVQNQIDFFMKNFGYTESAVNLMGIQNIALDLRGQELFIDYYEDPEFLHSLFDIITNLSLCIGKRLYAVSSTVSGGVTSIIKQVCPSVYLTSNCSVTMISNDLYCEHLLEHDTKLANEFTCFGIHHCGSNMENVIEGYLKVPNLKFIEIGAGSNLPLIAEAIKGKDIVSCIRYSPVALMNDSFDQIKMQTEKAIEAFGSHENLCFSCVGIDANVEISNVKEYLSVFRNKE